MSRQIPSPGLGRLISATLRPRYRGVLSDFTPELANCWVAGVPRHLLSDRESGSRLIVYEDGRPLGSAHSVHDDIRRIGLGRYSHWGAEIYISTSDNSDPRCNGRRYTIEEA